MDLLRPYLLPLTHSLPTPLVTLGHTLLGPQCYKILLLDLDISLSSSSRPCLSLALSKTLSLAIITLSSIVKIPQILKLLQSRSARGISFLGYVLETSAYLVTLVYSARRRFPFTAYGETALIAVQDVVVCLLVLVYGGWGGVVVGGFGAVLAAGVYVLQSEGVVGMEVLQWVQAGAGGLGVASKVPQIWTVYREGGTGQLSAFGVFTYLMGSLMRIFTTLQEVDDKLILYGFVAGFLLNAVLAAQMVYYWRSPATARHAGELGEKARGVMEKGESTAVEGNAKGKGKGKAPSTRRRG
ncbi:MAG: hypothetical protein LQ338_006922 [Usnochroma carphineum]|nr:MAG: hypothetical protein LQ338_006922 [Usnochroma carphineum]